MSSPSPSPILRPVLIAFGLVFIFGIPALNRLWAISAFSEGRLPVCSSGQSPGLQGG
jgi:hypothetical protein